MTPVQAGSLLTRLKMSADNLSRNRFLFEEMAHKPSRPGVHFLKGELAHAQSSRLDINILRRQL